MRIWESCLPSSVVSSPKSWITLASSVRRPAIALFSFAVYSTKGSKRRRALPSWVLWPPIPCAPPATSSWMYWRVSESRLARNWSRLTFGSVCASPNLWPSSTGSVPLPGSTSTVMSFSPVFGRSRNCESGWISFMYFGSISIPTTAWPSSSVTEPTLPIWMLATTTAWPWPGVTACAVWNSAEMCSNSSPTKGIHDGSEAFCSVKIPSIITMPARARTKIAIVSVRWPRTCRPSQARKWRTRLRRSGVAGVCSLTSSPRSPTARPGRPCSAGR